MQSIVELDRVEAEIIRNPCFPVGLIHTASQAVPGCQAVGLGAGDCFKTLAFADYYISWLHHL